MDKLTIPSGEKEQIEVYTHDGPFAEGVAAFKEKGLSLITAYELARGRLFGGVKELQKNPLNWEHTWVAESFNYLPTGEILIASRDYNSHLKNPDEALCYRDGREFYLGPKLKEKLRERAEADPKKAVKSGVLLLPRKAVKDEIPSTALIDNPLTYFLFRDTAEPYGQFLKENNISFIPVHVVDADYAKKQKRAFIRPLWIGDVYGFCSSRTIPMEQAGSVLDGVNDIIDLRGFSIFPGEGNFIWDAVGLVRGVRQSPKVSKEPTVNDLDSILQTLKKGTSFEYDGTTYVPLKQDIIERAK